jgi:glycosyltransferase involved in cell wall biosynthesis
VNKVNLRVLHVLHELQRSGAEMNLLLAAGEWSRRGFALDILATAPEVGPLAARLSAVGYAVHHLPLRSAKRFIPETDFCSKFITLCRKNNYDIVHIHPEHAYYLIATLCKMAGIETIVRSVHNVYPYGRALRLRKTLERYYTRLLGVRFGFVSPSVGNAEFRDFKNDGVVIRNWFDTEHFRPPSAEERAATRRDGGVSKDDFVIVSVGNCNAAKNHAALLRALGIIASKIDFLYLHVGREEPGYGERKLAEELGIASRVRFVGQTDDPRSYLWAADVFVMPSLWEGLGIAALEAAATELPLILADVAGLRDVGKELKWSELLPPTPEALASGILKLFKADSANLKEHAREDSALVRDLFSPSRGVQLLIRDLYQLEDASPDSSFANEEALCKSR